MQCVHFKTVFFCSSSFTGTVFIFLFYFFTAEPVLNDSLKQNSTPKFPSAAINSKKCDKQFEAQIFLSLFSNDIPETHLCELPRRPGPFSIIADLPGEWADHRCKPLEFLGVFTVVLLVVRGISCMWASSNDSKFTYLYNSFVAILGEKIWCFKLEHWTVGQQ